MKLFVVILAVSLLGASAATISDICPCAAGASTVCVDGDAIGGDGTAALGPPVTLELRDGSQKQLAEPPAMSRLR